MTIQDQLDAAAVNGGTVEIQAGVNENGGQPLLFDNLSFHNSVFIKGEGLQSIIPCLRSKRPGERMWNIHISDLCIDGRLSPMPGQSIGYIMVDCRNVTQGSVKRCQNLFDDDGVPTVQIGLGLYYDAYNNVYEQNIFSGRLFGADVYGGANQNGFSDNKFYSIAGGTALRFSSVNGNTVNRGSIEIPPDAKGVVDGSAEIFPGVQPINGNYLRDVRLEKTGTYGPAWWR